ncbi:T-cell activation Rho GTPase activating protein, putative [Entamoeba invadens IP1]|uniref:T-cell activation Rho GTPase activating protein, putative n=1 Tax=Entamoeba invadens IP1 TaxID=370355 RepID=A0A0A1U7I2_ENTIV|nr:T-cell activation Rho GTPase activating protein, putative [Entamoeba invadens IP1]ELP89006.1 T-cell activation Rho GTPase activating protein, putative [Entamoeba invadens IP1]|eukprot:XP_004255777.1 T-cell activation Rho GTPase activating protein, putative [Entamoeba invadens IP1]
MTNVSSNELDGYLDDVTVLNRCVDTFERYTSTLLPLFEQIHTEMSEYTQLLQQLSSAKGTENPNRLRSKLLEPLITFSEAQQQLSESFYDLKEEVNRINQSTKDLQQTCLQPLTSALLSYTPQAKWNIWSWWSQPPKEYSDATKIQLSLTLGSWEFKLKVGGLIEAFYRVFQDGAITASGNENFTLTMTKARIEKTKYFCKYKKCVGGYMGKSLDEILKLEEREGAVPFGIENLIENIKNKGYTTEGIFRLAPSDRDIDEVSHRLGVMDFDGMDFVVMSSVLKRFFRNLPQKIFNKQLTDRAMAINNSQAFNTGTLKSFIKMLPKNHIPIVRELFGLFYKINTYSDTNKMSSLNLAIVWVPCLFEVPIDQNFQTNLDQLKPFFAAFIDKFYDVFPECSDRKSLRLSTYRQSFHERTLTRSESEWKRSLESVDNVMK